MRVVDLGTLNLKNPKVRKTQSLTNPIPKKYTCVDIESCHTIWKHKNTYVNEEVVRKLRPMMIAIGGTETLTGFILVMIVHYGFMFFDSIFSRVVSNPTNVWMATFFGLMGISFSGSTLLLSIALNNQLLAWMNVVFQTMVAVYIFFGSVTMLHFSLKILMDESTLMSTTTEKYYFDVLLPPCDGLSAVSNIPINNACLMAILALLGTFAYVSGALGVYTFYKFRYLKPLVEDD